MMKLVPALLVLTLVACGAPRRAEDVIPVRGRDVRATLAGAWDIYDDRGERAGGIELDGDRFVADSRRNRLFGSWDIVDRDGNAHLTELIVDGYDEGGVREIYGTPDRVLLRLVFIDHDRIVAIQEGAAWSEWQRAPLPTAAPAEAAPDDAAEAAPDDAAAPQGMEPEAPAPAEDAP